MVRDVLCRRQVELSNLVSHAVERLDKHLEVITTKIAAVERTMHGRTSGERSVTERLGDIESNVRVLDAAVRGSAVGRASNAAAAAAAGAAGSGDVQSILVSTGEKMVIYEGVITVLNREVEKLGAQVSVCQHLPIYSVSMYIHIHIKFKTRANMITSSRQSKHTYALVYYYYFEFLYFVSLFFKNHSSLHLSICFATL